MQNGRLLSIFAKTTEEIVFYEIDIQKGELVDKGQIQNYTVAPGTLQENGIYKDEPLLSVLPFVSSDVKRESYTCNL